MNKDILIIVCKLTYLSANENMPHVILSISILMNIELINRNEFHLIILFFSYEYPMSI